jgi:uncharacterized protein
MIQFSNKIITLRPAMIRKLLKSLLKAAAYPEPTADVRLIETHVSYIFITDSFVYKVKKPVDFGFLNFTTLDRRRFYCEEEVRLNRRLSPELYLGVVELRSGPGGPAFGGPGALVDYAVKMKRLPEERMLARLLERGELQGAQLAQIARVIAEFHGRAARGPQIDAQGSAGAIRAVWEENFRQAECCPPLPRSDLALIRGWVERFLATGEALLRERVAGGFIRECDGDLHLGNICLTDRVHIFDCIEFNERFRFIDTAADIAFLLMDLEYAGRPDLCPPFLEAYREASADPVPPRLLNFYQAQRAFVRGKVQCLRLGEPGIADGEIQTAREAAGRYFRLARGYCLRDGFPATLILTCGVMGSGKSALARELCRELGLSRIASDPVRKSLFGSAPGESGGAGYHGGIYSPAHTRATYRALLEGARRELEAGRGVVVDATFRSRADREEFRAQARAVGVPFFLVHVRCDPGLIRERLERRCLQPGEISDGRPELLPRQLSEFEAPEPGEALMVDSALPLSGEVDLVLRGMGILP